MLLEVVKVTGGLELVLAVLDDVELDEVELVLVVLDDVELVAAVL